MTGISTDRDEIVWRMDTWTARQLSYILDREARPLGTGTMEDAGWRADADALFAAAEAMDDDHPEQR